MREPTQIKGRLDDTFKRGKTSGRASGFTEGIQYLSSRTQESYNQGFTFGLLAGAAATSIFFVFTWVVLG